MTNDTIAKKVMEAIQQRYKLNPLAESFDFELGGLGGRLNNENDYSTLKDALEGLTALAGIKYAITEDSILYESYKCKITIEDKKKFEDFSSKQTPEDSSSIEFNDNEVTLTYGNKRCQLPPFKNEHFFCRAIFEHPANEPVDWSTIYEKMTGYDGEGVKSLKDESRKVYDSMEALNKRIEKVFGIKGLFIWREKTVTRTK